MKTILRKISVFLVITVIIAACSGVFTYAAAENLDEIEIYEITVNVREDGTLDIRYDVEWRVLSDKNGSEPVTWVKI